jgi:hypothetical protein
VSSNLPTGRFSNGRQYVVKQEFSAVAAFIVPSFRKLATPAAIFACFAAWTIPAAAQGRLEAEYEASLGALVIGKGAWVVDIGDEQFTATVAAGTAGVLKSLGSGNGTGTSNGRVISGQLVPANYLSTINYGPKNETIRITLNGGNVKDSSIEPIPPVHPDRIVVTDAHRRNVLDPMTGSLLRVGGSGDPLSPDACNNKTVSVFDGRMRYDLKLDFKRIEQVKAAKGYQGAAVACAVGFVPISGYVPDRYAIKYLVAQKNMEIWFAPIAGTRVLAPFRIVIPTPVGTGVIEATKFVSAQKTAKTN